MRKCGNLFSLLSSYVSAARPASRGLRSVSADSLTARRFSVPHDCAGTSVAPFSLWFALPGHRLHIVGEDGPPCVTNLHVGDILLRVPSVMLGYYKQDPASTGSDDSNGCLAHGRSSYLAGGDLFVFGARTTSSSSTRKYHPAEFGLAVDSLGGVRRVLCSPSAATEIGAGVKSGR